MHFYKGTSIPFKIIISNQTTVTIEIMQPRKYNHATFNKTLDCAEWNDFWVLVHDEYISLGKGLIYNINTLKTVKYKKQSLSSILTLRNFGGNNHIWKVNDLGEWIYEIFHIIIYFIYLIRWKKS